MDFTLSVACGAAEGRHESREEIRDGPGAVDEDVDHHEYLKN